MEDITPFQKALKSGVSGASAMSIQVCSLMWLRTTVNYQYRTGNSLKYSFNNLYKDGGIRRFYRGIGPALFQGPLSRFGDTASNTGVLSLLDSNEYTKNLPLFIKSVCSSGCAALWRINIMPIDTLKTSLQVHGSNGISLLNQKYKKNGIKIYYHGSMGAFTATYIGHLPWYTTYNYLDNYIDNYENNMKQLSRNALIGFCSSAISDTCSNSIRVLKTVKQTNEVNISYIDSARHIIKNDGYVSLFTRGLNTKIISNGIQSMMFTVLWKYFQNKYN
jgi:hypothetical protein